MAKGLYPDDLADATKERAGEKYRPSNGTEGEIFRTWFCDRCTKDANEDCRILDETFLYDVDDPEYPSEWQYGEDGQPKCTAFEERGNA